MRRGEMERGIALDAVKLDIATRIRHVCDGFSEAEFAELVDQMAEIDVRYRLRDDMQFYGLAQRTGRRAPSDRMHIR